MTRHDDALTTAEERREDIRMLRAILSEYESLDEDDRLYRTACGAASRVESMLARLQGNPDLLLTEKQRSYVHDIYEKLFDAPIYANLVSAGKVPLGNPVETPAVLKNLPLKPPKPRSTGQGG
jgi:hypothetical protein